MNDLIVRIATPDGEAFSGEAKSILVKTTEGDVQVMRGHTDYFAALGTGRAKLTLLDGTERLAACSGGFITVSSGEVSVLATTFEFSDTIDLARAEEAKENAQAALSASKEHRDIELAKAKLSRALTRISVAGK